MQETWVQYLSWEHPLEEGMATHSSILAWRSPIDRGAWGATVHGIARSQARLSDQAQYTYITTHPQIQARLQQYVNYELPDVQAGFRKGRGTRDQIASIRWIIKKAREFQKNIYFCFIDYAQAFVWITTICGKLFKRWEYQTTWPASWEIYMQVKKQQLHWTWNNRLVPNLEKSTSRLYIVTLLI